MVTPAEVRKWHFSDMPRQADDILFLLTGLKGRGPLTRPGLPVLTQAV